MVTGGGGHCGGRGGGGCSGDEGAAGKVARLAQWLAERDNDLADSWFYSDSHNDLPLLKQVARPVAVDPDDILHQHAVAHDWRIMSLRS